MKIEQRHDSPTITALRTLEANRLADGSVELIVNESTKKYNGERWSTRTVSIAITAEQWQQLLEGTTWVGQFNREIAKRGEAGREIR